MSELELQVIDDKLSAEVLNRSEADLVTQRMIERTIQSMVKHNEEEYARYLEHVSKVGETTSGLRELIDNVQSNLTSAIADIQQQQAVQTTDVDDSLAVIQAHLTKYIRILEDATLDSERITWDNGEIQLGAWTFLSQARMWDLQILKDMKLFQAQLSADVYKTVEEHFGNYDTTETLITKVIDQLSDAKIIKQLDKSLAQQTTTIQSVSDALASEVRERVLSMNALSQGVNEFMTSSIEEVTDTITSHRTEYIDEFANIKNQVTESNQLLTMEISSTKTAIDDLKNVASIENIEEISAKVIPLKAGGSWKASSSSKRASSYTLRMAQVADDKVLASRIDVVEATLGDLPDEFARVTSEMQASISVINDNLFATAEAIQSTSTSLGDLTTTVTAHSKSIDGIYGEYMIKVNANGLISGFGLVNDGNTSAFGIDADAFYVGGSDSSSKPFMVTTRETVVNGVTYPPGVWINNVLIGDGSLGSAKIADAAITNAKIDSLDASKITTGLIESGRVSIGGNSTFEDGYDPIKYGWQVVTTSVDLATLFTSGKYLLKGSVLNSPLASPLYVIVDAPEEGEVTQSIYKHSKVRDSYTRTYANDLWSVWIKGNYAEEFEDISTVIDGTTYIEGGRIVTGSIEANKLNVDRLSAISGELGDIKVKTGNIEDLAVTTLKIGNRAVTSSIMQNINVSWVNTYNISSDYNYTWDKTFELYGFENSTVGAQALLFLQPIQASIIGDNSDALYVNIYLNNVKIGEIPSCISQTSAVTGYGTGEDTGTYVAGYAYARQVLLGSTIMSPFVVTQDMVDTTVSLKLELAHRYQKVGYPLNNIKVRVNFQQVTSYLVEFKR